MDEKTDKAARAAADSFGIPHFVRQLRAITRQIVLW